MTVGMEGAGEENGDLAISEAEDLIAYCAKHSSMIGKYGYIAKTETPVYSLDAIRIFGSLCKKAGLSFDDLYARYLAKNVLNAFRQNNGYKEGAYRKIWGGKEDNVWAVALAQTSEGADDLYEKLEKAYKDADSSKTSC